MLKTTIAYKKKPSNKAVTELMNLMPILDITWKLETSPLVTKKYPFYNSLTLDWEWFDTLFNNPDVACLCLEPTDLKKVGIKDHWGFYSLLDGDTKHQFYITNLKRLSQKAKKNGFTTDFARMFVHEFLHGARWEETKNRQMAVQDVHDWEDQGLLKEKLAEYIQNYKKLKEKVSLLEKLLATTKTLFAPKQIAMPSKGL